MTKKVEEPTQGIHIDIDKPKAFVITVMFALFFLAPVFGYQYYVSTKNLPTTKETYTAEALSIEEHIGLGLNEPSIAGVSTERASFNYTIPWMGVTVTDDFKNPTNLLILVGGIATITSIIVLLGQSFDLFKSGKYR